MIAALGLLPGPVASAQDLKPETKPEIQRWIAELAAPDFEAREAASRALLAEGPTVREALLAARSTMDIEGQLRVDAVLARLSGPVLRVTVDCVAPRASFEIENGTLAEAVRAITLAFGHPVALGPAGTAPDPSTQGVALKLESATFLQALDALCAQHEMGFQRDFRTGEYLLRSGYGGQGPVQHRGPLRVGASSFRVSRQTDFQGGGTTSAHLGFVVDIDPSWPVVGTLMATEIPPAKDDKGREIAFQPPFSGAARYMQPLQMQRRHHVNLNMDPPAPDAVRLEEVTLPLEFVVAEEFLVDRLLVEDISAESASSEGPLGISVSEVERTDTTRQIDVQFQAPTPKGPFPLRTIPALDQITLVHADGSEDSPRILRTTNQGATRTLRVEAKMAPITEVRVESLSLWRVLREEVVFTKLPLP